MLNDLLESVKSLMQADSTLNGYLATMRIAEGGDLEPRVKKPAAIISPGTVEGQDSSIGNKRLDRVFPVTIYVYNEFYGREVGMIGDSQSTGLIQIAEQIVSVLHLEKPSSPSGCYDARWLRTEYPAFRERNYTDMNEARVYLEYKVRADA
jgi:hypothetical protein